MAGTEEIDRRQAAGATTQVTQFLRFPADRRISWRQIAVLLLLATVVRGAGVAASWDRFQDDPDGYRQLAQNLLEHGAFGHPVPREGQIQVVPTAYRPPVYPMLLAAFGAARNVDTLSVAVLHVLLGVATVLLVAIFASRSFGGPVAAVAAVLVLVDPILLNQSGLVMTETLAALLAIAAWSLLSGPSRLGPRCTAGLVLGIAALCRPVFIVWLALAAAVLLASAIRRRDLWPAVGFCAAAGLVLAPWIVRNVVQFQRPIATTTHGGYTVWLGNNDEYYDFLRTAPRGSVWDSTRLDQRYAERYLAWDRDEVATDRWANQQARQCIQRQPEMFVRACLGRVTRLWGWVPNRLAPDESNLRRYARWAVGVWYFVQWAFILAAVAMLRQQLLSSPWLWAVLLAVSLTAVHCIYWTDMRMRAPMIPMLAVAAAWGFVRVSERMFGGGRS